MLACEGKLAHLGLDKAPARSTLSDANAHRSYLVFETIYFDLLRKYHGFISDSRLKGLSIRNLKIIDSTTIRLFSDILRGVGRNPLDGARKKGGIKVHALMDAFSGVTEFLRITAAKEHDRMFLYHVNLPANSFIVFDKAYNLYSRSLNNSFLVSSLLAAFTFSRYFLIMSILVSVIWAEGIIIEMQYRSLLYCILTYFLSCSFYWRTFGMVLSHPPVCRRAGMMCKIDFHPSRNCIYMPVRQLAGPTKADMPHTSAAGTGSPKGDTFALLFILHSSLLCCGAIWCFLHYIVWKILNPPVKISGCLK
jgi:hypothetical protein